MSSKGSADADACPECVHCLGGVLGASVVVVRELAQEGEEIHLPRQLDGAREAALLERRDTCAAAGQDGTRLRDEAAQE
eukprot:CAMPEP_0185200798 /NCGR_PEP_ID=MMETSP1140-20130426/48018_1 /TAXON_ID=298111 /ORGANISM="Pavlova sp., Strain CCMP459" /LENGTH=78 /DNA_ID=CAMNT_0027768153 /DNA_START=193 /DNA_END=430 /DNA_ORIENTATION=+